MPYRGLGSGIPRAIEFWPKIDFRDDRDGCLFVATVHRDSAAVPERASEKTSEKTSEKILDAIRQRPELTIAELAQIIRVTTRSIERNLRKLQEQGRLHRIGPDKGGRWEVLK